MARKTKEETEKKTKAPKKEKAAKAERSEKVEAVGHEDGSLPKIQCFNKNKKTICAHLLLDRRKCGVKTIAAGGRLATVRLGKKRRCEFYEETAYTR